MKEQELLNKIDSLTSKEPTSWHDDYIKRSSFSDSYLKLTRRSRRLRMMYKKNEAKIKELCNNMPHSTAGGGNYKHSFWDNNTNK